MRVQNVVKLWWVVVMCAANVACAQVTREMRSSAGQDAERGTGGAAYTASHEVRAAMTLQLTTADAAQGGAVTLEFTAKRGTTDVLLRVPLAGTNAAQGEARECTVAADGNRSLRFTAGVEPANFMAFAPAAKAKEIDLLLNRYLCRALAAPFDCAGTAVSLPERWDGWKLAGTARLTMTSGAPAVLKTSPVVIAETADRFSNAQCAASTEGAGRVR